METIQRPKVYATEETGICPHGHIVVVDYDKTEDYDSCEEYCYQACGSRFAEITSKK